MKRVGGMGIAIWLFSSAVAASPRAVVTIEAGVTGCLTSAELAARVESAFIGADAPPVDQILRVSVSRAEGGGLLADVRWTGATQETPRRALESASDECQELDNAIPLVARALWEAEIGAKTSLIEPQEAAPRAVAPTPPSEPRRPVASVASPAPRDTASLPRAHRSPFQLAFGGAGVLGALESTAFALRLEARVPVGKSWALRFAASRLTDGRVAQVDEGQARFSAVTGRAAGCWVVPSAFSVDACLGVDAGALRPQLSEVARGNERVRPLLWPVALVAGRLRLLGPLGAQISVAAGPALIRQDFYLTDARGEARAVLRTAPALVEAGLSLVVELE